MPYLKEVSTISNICTYNLLVWNWIDDKFDIKWMYLLCFIFVDTALLLCGADLSRGPSWHQLSTVCAKKNLQSKVELEEK